VLVLRLGLGLALGLQLGIAIGFRRNHSWSSAFTPRRNHSLCHKIMNGFEDIDYGEYFNISSTGLRAELFS